MIDTEVSDSTEKADVEIREDAFTRPSNVAETTTRSSNIRAVLICLFSMSGALLFGIDSGLVTDIFPERSRSAS
jgi:hypothetical protein